VKLAIYNVRGELVQTLLQRELAAGEHAIPFDGRGFASGMYFYRLETKDFVTTRKMILEK
ncbi:T9SS type A sorting domain-containing protein, partial [candidate division KSB1 bacterium]|nr:T9SS type A sorting domain-containing protein [candidate division KSB1 bacterium]